MPTSDNGWNEYSRLVLEQLETLSAGIDAVRDEMQGIKQELAIMKAKEDRITELKAWKEKIDEEVEAGALRITNESGLKYKFQVGETTPLGVFIDNKKVISINTISNMKTSLEGTNYDFLQVGSSSMVFVKNKIIIAYIYSDVDSEKDIIWIEGKTKELVNLLIKNN